MSRNCTPTHLMLRVYSPVRRLQVGGIFPVSMLAAAESICRDVMLLQVSGRELQQQYPGVSTSWSW